MTKQRVTVTAHTLTYGEQEFYSAAVVEDLRSQIKNLQAQVDRHNAIKPELWEISNPGEGTYYVSDKPAPDNWRYSLIVAEWYTKSEGPEDHED